MRSKDFWAMSPGEFWWQYEARRPRKQFGSMTEEEAEDCWQVLQRGEP